VTFRRAEPVTLPAPETVTMPALLIGVTLSGATGGDPPGAPIGDPGLDWLAPPPIN
jgi:hypothetical protein